MIIHGNPFFAGVTNGPPETDLEPSVEELKKAAVVHVDRVRHTALDGSIEIWLKIHEVRGKKLSQRPPNTDDKCILSKENPSYFSIWADDPPRVWCFAEWKNREWQLLAIYNPAILAA